MTALTRLSLTDFRNYAALTLPLDGRHVCLYGANGAGKTTTIRVLLDLFHPKRGQVSLFGKELLDHREDILGKIGALIENPSIYKHLSGRQNLEVVRKMVGGKKERIEEVLKIVRLVDNADKKAKNYSLGMCQRLGLAAALLTDPELLILDEPTNGLDPSGIIEMRELIIRLNKEHGKTIFLSSHILSEIEKLATDVAIIDQGKILYQGKLEGLKNGGENLMLAIKVFLATLGYASLQFWMSQRWKNLLLPLGIGIGGWISFLILVQGWKYVEYHPYGFPMLGLGNYQDPAYEWLGELKFVYRSVGLAAVVFVLAGWDMVRKRVV